MGEFVLCGNGPNSASRVRFATVGRNLYRTANRGEQLYFPVATAVSLSTDRSASSAGSLLGWSEESRGSNGHAAPLKVDTRIARISRKISDEPSNC